jgi:hypothetical protein
MKRIVQLVAGALLAAGTANAAAAQDDATGSSGGFFKAPVFALQPGILSVNAISGPEGAETDNNLNARFLTLLPTSSPYFTLLGGAQWGVEKDGHGPIIFYGAIIPIPGITEATQGWLSLSVDPLGVTTAGAGRATDTEFVLEGAAVLNIGSKMMTNSPWRGLGIYALLDQQITGLPEDANGDVDRFSPVLLYGLSLPIAPWGN